MIDKLNSISTNPVALTNFLQTEIHLVYDYFLVQSHSELKKNQAKVDSYILSNYRTLIVLDLSIKEVYTFYICLLDICERFGFRLYFKRFHSILKRCEYSISHRLEAAALYTTGVRDFTDYEKAFESIVSELQKALDTEEDNDSRVISTFVNFYAQVVQNFGEFYQEGITLIRNRILQCRGDFYFLQNDVIDKILSIETLDFQIAFEDIHKKLDEYLERSSVSTDYTEGANLIEASTCYCTSLSVTEADFKNIYRISAKEYSAINDDSIFYSLGRGVSILQEEEQLYAYMYSYGKMHNAKLTYAFDMLLDTFFDSKIELIDWGCGQALASFTYLDFLKRCNYQQEIERITLNEPSEIAIKRGALHIAKYNRDISRLTINKDLDSLHSFDFVANENIKLHLFSNILDIDRYSMEGLTSLIKSTFKGTNYFIIVSPYITEVKTNRIDNFVGSIMGNSESELLHSLDMRKGEWRNNWTMVLRIFNAEIE